MIFIRIKLKGYLKNITENENNSFNVKGIKTNNKIVFYDNDVKTTIKLDTNSITLIRDGRDFTNTLLFNKEKSVCNYFLKEHDYNFDIKVKTHVLDIRKDFIYIEYVVLDSNNKYEYKLEIGDEE